MSRGRAWGVLVCAVALWAGSGAAAASTAQLVEKWMKGEHRAPGHAARNSYRHPRGTLNFFGLEPSMRVVEVWPSGGWYLEILAPLLRDSGTYYAAGFALTAKRTPEWRKKVQRELNEKLAERPDLYDRVVVTELSIPERTEMAPPGTADLVLTFRNVHNWMKGDYAPAMFDAMFAALRPGGTLGVVEHRAKKGTSRARMIETGYVTEAQVRRLAKDAGFRFVEASKVNANPKDTTDHPAGVWTLPPTLRLGEQGRAKYLAIGESDRMTLRFVRPRRTGSKDSRR
jgi:predicted methyltransferase